MQTPKPYTVLQTDPGENFPKPVFTIHAYSLEAARALVAAMIAGEVIVLPAVSKSGARR